MILKLLGSSASSTNSIAASKAKATGIDVAGALRRLEAGTAILVDVREPQEHAREHIRKARLVPLSRFSAHDFSADCARVNAAIFYCQSGARTAMNARRFTQAGFGEAFVLEGGIAAWKRAGKPTSAS